MTDVDKKKIEKYRNLILDIPGINSAEYINSTTSSVTLSWGVEGSPDYIARDIIQNFRDANHTEIDAINVKTKNDQIVVSAKSTFDLRKLLFLGSNKDLPGLIIPNSTSEPKGILGFDLLLTIVSR